MNNSLDLRAARRRFLASRGQPLTQPQVNKSISQSSSSQNLTSPASQFKSLDYQGFDPGSGKYKAYNPATDSEELVDIIVDGETGGFPLGSDILVTQGTATFG